MLRVSVTEVDTVQPPSRRSELAHPISPAPHNPTRAHSPTCTTHTAGSAVAEMAGVSAAVVWLRPLALFLLERTRTAQSACLHAW